MSDSIYLDNAATSYPKPVAVYDAIDQYNREIGAPIGRGSHQRAVKVQSVIQRCRSRVAELLRAESADQIVFTFNGTDSLNLVIHGLVRTGDHVVTTVVEHNSVLRPLRYLQDHQDVSVTYVDCDDTGRVYPALIRESLQPNTRLIAVVHASNVTGTIQPIAEIGEIARAADIPFLVDAAQTAGHLPIDLHQLPIDLLACPGHKGLLGPLGTGILYVRPGIEESLLSTRQGGTGSQSEDDHQPDTMPDKYESGNHNAPGIFGLDAALEYVLDRGVDNLRQHELGLTQQLLDGFQKIDTIRVVGPSNVEDRAGVVSVASEMLEPQILATILDENFGIQTRAGLHCAPLIHKRMGTFASGGTVRFSIGPFNSADHINAALQAISEVSTA